MSDDFSNNRSQSIWRGIGGAVVGLILISLITGCHGSSSPSADTQASQSTAKSALPAAATDTPKSTDTATADLLSSEERAAEKPSDSNAPAPRFLKRKLVTAQFPDKTPQATWEVKVYSDGSERYDGLHVEYYTNGTKLLEGKYVDGKKEGDWRFWSKNGKLIKTEKYSNGKVNGSWTLFRDDGSKERDVSYKDGLRDGIWIDYDPDGKNQRVEQKEFKAGKKDGTWIHWNLKNGHETIEEHYKNGQLDGLQTGWYDNGKLRETDEYKNGQLDGKRVRWKDNGEKIDETIFKDGKSISSGDEK